MEIKIENILDTDLKCIITRRILESLPKWFGIKDSRENYINESIDQYYLSATINNEVVGFLALKPTGKHTLELAVMGVLECYHKNGVGKALFKNAYKYASKNGYSFIQVKTVKMGCYDIYDRTNKFYLSLGFEEFEVFPTLWGKENPCQIYIMSVK